MDIGLNIRRVRTDKSMTLKELSNKATVSLTSLHYIESGVNSPTIKTVLKIARALEVPIIALLGENQSKGDSPKAVGK